MAMFLKPVVFKLDGHEYGVDINLVSGIEKYQQIVPVPNSVSYIKGIINLRGEVIPVYDLRKKFNINVDTSISNDEKKLIVVKIKDVFIAIEVDGVSEIHDFAKENITEMPSIVLNNETKYFTYVANVQGHLILLIDVEYLLSDDEVESVKKLKEDLM